MKFLLAAKSVKILLVFKVSRLFRVGYLGFQFMNEEIVEAGLRGISVSQGIDTREEKTWKQLMYLHGMMDEMLLETIADHVRSGLSHLFQSGFVTGALTLGYHGAQVPGAPPTKRGLPRRIPAVTTEVAALIVQHYEWIRDGLPIRVGFRRWVATGGPCDPRANGKMTYMAYRRMLSNPRYIGIWAFGRKRNRWQTKLDYCVQVDRPETEVIVARCEELRIMPDELFLAVEERLANHKRGPRAAKTRKDPQLWDLVTDCFQCAACSTEKQLSRLHQAGADGYGMRCKHGDSCPRLSVVRRKPAVMAACKKLGELLNQDAEMVIELIARAGEIDERGDDDLRRRLEVLDRDVLALDRKVNDLMDMAGEGSSEDRATTKAKVKGAQLDRAARRSERARVQAELAAGSRTITAAEIRGVLADFTRLLVDGAAGTLGVDLVYTAADVFRRLVGGRVMVHVLDCPGRKRKNILGKFVPRIVRALRQELLSDGDDRVNEEVCVWLRPMPRCDRVALRAHELIDVQKLSFPEAARVLQEEGERINVANLYNVYYRYYQMISQPPPRRGNGHGAANAGDESAA